MLEPYEGKLSRTVLRGERESNLPDLLDRTVLVYGGSLINYSNLRVKVREKEITRFDQSLIGDGST